MSKLSAEQVAELKSAFEAFDTNSDGVISRDELKNLLVGLLGEDVDEIQIEEMLNLADSNEDGKVNFEEFCAACEADME